MNYEAMANEELAALAQEGDTDAETILYSQVERLIYKLSGKYALLCGRAGIDEDDLMQECWIGFHNAVMGYQSGKGMFSTYLGFHIKSACMRALNIRDGKMRIVPTVPLDTPVKGGEDITIADMIADESIDVTGGVEITDLQRVVRGAVARLPEQEQRLICAVYLESMNVSQYAQSEKITPSAAHSMHTRALRALRRDVGIRALRPYYCIEYGRNSEVWDAEHRIHWRDDHEAIERRIDEGVSLYLAWCSDNSIQPDITAHRRELVMWEATQLNKI